MILKMVLGTSARGLLSYISNPTKTANNHTHPFHTNMAGQTPRELSKEISNLRKLRPNLRKAIAHMVLSHDSNDRKLTDVEWKQAISIALKTHGASETAFAAYLHKEGTDHAHTHVFF